MPGDVLRFFESGTFVCSIKGKLMHSVALDEAHEMCINKDLKTTIVRPTKEYLDRILYYYPVRVLVLKAMKHQTLIDADTQAITKVFDTSPHSLKVEENIQCMASQIGQSNCLLKDAGSRNLQSICGQPATPEQESRFGM